MLNSTVSSFAGDVSLNCSSTTNVDLSTVDVDFKALQYSMLITIIVEVLGAIFFFATAWYLQHFLFFKAIKGFTFVFYYRYIVDDKAKVDRAVAG